MSQRTFAASAERGKGSRSWPARLPRSAGKGTDEISTTDAARRRDDGVRRTPEPIRSGRGWRS